MTLARSAGAIQRLVSASGIALAAGQRGRNRVADMYVDGTQVCVASLESVLVPERAIERFERPRRCPIPLQLCLGFGYRHRRNKEAAAAVILLDITHDLADAAGHDRPGWNTLTWRYSNAPKLERTVCECYRVVKDEFDRLLGKDFIRP